MQIYAKMSKKTAFLYKKRAEYTVVYSALKTAATYSPTLWAVPSA